MKKKKILVVDDEPNILKIVCIRLQLNGYEVVMAGDGAEGLVRARSDHPDLILLDIAMPPPDGAEVCRILKQDPDCQTIPVILLTAKGLKEARALANKSGADTFVVKPYSSEDLLTAIRSLLEGKNRR